MRKCGCSKRRGMGYSDESPMRPRRKTCFSNSDIQELLRLTNLLKDLSYGAGKTKDYHRNEIMYDDAQNTRQEIHSLIEKARCQ